MARSPYVLAALVSAAVPHARLLRTRVLDGDEAVDGVDAAVVEAADGSRWWVRAPAAAAAGAELQRERAVVGALAEHAERTGAELPFAVPEVTAAVPLEEGGAALVGPRPPGAPLEAVALTDADAASAALAASLGRALAAVHDLPTALVEELGLPVFTAEEHRERRLDELDRAAGTGAVPPGLLGRWERALEAVGRWRFPATVVHGDLGPERVFADGDRVTAVLGWAAVRVGDPADDLGWLDGAAGSAALAAVLDAHAAARRRGADSSIGERARLAGELALVRWLLHGTATDDDAVVADATHMLRDLDAVVGGQRL